MTRPIKQSNPTQSDQVPNYGSTSSTNLKKSPNNNNQPSGSSSSANNNSNTNQVQSNSNNENNSKIEPKVWLANERTWLNWCRTGVLLGTFGLALVNSSPSKGSRIMGMVYSLIAVGTISYGYFLYQRRVTLIKQKYSGHFDEVLVPLIIASSLFIAISLNFIFRVIDVAKYDSSKVDETDYVPWIAAPVSITNK